MRTLSKREVAACARNRALAAAREKARDEARVAFRAWATQQGWDVSSRDGFNDYHEERTFYAWLGYERALGLDAGTFHGTMNRGRA